MATDATETKPDMNLEVTKSKGPGKKDGNVCFFGDILKRQCAKLDHAVVSLHCLFKRCMVWWWV